MDQMPFQSPKELKESQGTDPNQWLGLILSSTTTKLLSEEALLHLCCLPDVSTCTHLNTLIVMK